MELMIFFNFKLLNCHQIQIIFCYLTAYPCMILLSVISCRSKKLGPFPLTLALYSPNLQIYLKENNHFMR